MKILLILFSLSFYALTAIVAPPSEFPVQPKVDNRTALEKHVSFFDRDNDGIIYPKETFEGMRAIGCGFALSTFAAAFINGGLSAKTRPGKPISLQFPIVIKNINLAKHGSDSGTYDEAGRFVPSKFEEIFAKHALSHGNSLTWDELQEMLKGNRVPKDKVGWLASFTEWKFLFELCKDKDGLLQKDTVRAVFDGSLFYQLASKKARLG